MAGVDKLYEYDQRLNEAQEKAKNESDYIGILAEAKSSSQAKQLAAQLIPRYFKCFPSFSAEAINVHFDLCEDDELGVSSSILVILSGTHKKKTGNVGDYSAAEPLNQVRLVIMWAFDRGAIFSGDQKQGSVIWRALCPAWFKFEDFNLLQRASFWAHKGRELLPFVMKTREYFFISAVLCTGKGRWNVWKKKGVVINRLIVKGWFLAFKLRGPVEIFYPMGIEGRYMICYIEYINLDHGPDEDVEEPRFQNVYIILPEWDFIVPLYFCGDSRSIGLAAIIKVEFVAGQSTGTGVDSDVMPVLASPVDS
eukprot:Gb_05968 [translate_table: standard]